MPITYQWRRDGVDIPGETTNQYLQVPSDEGSEISCEVTASNGVLPDAVIVVTAPRLTTNNSFIGNYEWNQSWSADTAPAVNGDIPSYQGGLSATLRGGTSYTTGISTGRLTGAEVGTARVGNAIDLTSNSTGGFEASGLVTPSGDLHVRLVLKSPSNDRIVPIMNLLNLSNTSNSETFQIDMDSVGSVKDIRINSRYNGFTGSSPVSNVISSALDRRNHWLIIDSFLSSSGHTLMINGQEYTGTALSNGWTQGGSLNLELLENVTPSDIDLHFVFAGIRYGSFTFSEHRNDYLGSVLEVPLAAISPFISGSLTPGSTLTLDTGSWEGDGTVLTQSWEHRSNPGVSLGTGLTYEIQPSDELEHIDVVVTGTNSVEAGQDVVTYTISGIEEVNDGNLLASDWKAAWLSSRVSGTGEALPSIVEGVNDLTLQSGDYTTGSATAPLTASDVGTLEVDDSISVTTNALWYDNNEDFRLLIDQTRRYRKLFKYTSGSSSSLFSIGLTSEEGSLVVEINSSGSLLATANVWDGSANQSLTFDISEIEVEDGWHLLDVVIGPKNGETQLSIFIDGSEYVKNLPIQYVPPEGDRVTVGGVDGVGAYSGDLLFLGYDNQQFSYDNHYSDWLNSSLVNNLITETDWDLAWSFDQAPDTPGGVPAFAGAFSLSLTGSYSTGGSTENLTSEAIGASRIDDALTPSGLCIFSSSITDLTTNYDNGFSNGFRFRAIIKAPSSPLNTTLFSLGGTNSFQVNLGSGIVNEVSVSATSNSETSTISESLIGKSGFIVIDCILDTDTTPSPNARRLRIWVDGESGGEEIVSSTSWNGLDGTSLSLNLTSLEGAIFIGVKAISSTEF